MTNCIHGNWKVQGDGEGRGQEGDSAAEEGCVRTG
jgi:hypothetical protein